MGPNVGFNIREWGELRGTQLSTIHNFVADFVKRGSIQRKPFRLLVALQSYRPVTYPWYGSGGLRWVIEGKCVYILGRTLKQMHYTAARYIATCEKASPFSCIILWLDKDTEVLYGEVYHAGANYDSKLDSECTRITLNALWRYVVSPPPRPG